jgi:hypothetical protein
MITRSVAQLLAEHVTLDVEGIDRLYLNAYQPRLQTGAGVAAFFKGHRGARVASTTLMAPMSRAFVGEIERFARREEMEVVRFTKGQRKDTVTKDRLKRFNEPEGLLYLGIAQERCSTFRVEKRVSPQTGKTFPWLGRSTVMCNQYYFYLVDQDFGPFFIKFSGYFPYTARICLNGHEYAKRQLDKEGIAYEPLDNGILSCEAPERLQQILDAFDEAKIEGVARKWFERLPHPFTEADREAGFTYNLSILQAEFARTQVFDRPLAGRHLFEEIVRENIDLGRPSQVSLIFNRRVNRNTPGTFRSRLITEGVDPSLHISYKNSKIKQYFKEDRAGRTETTINDTHDFGIGRRLENLPALRAIGFQANRRLLEVEKLTQDCRIGEAIFEQITQPQRVEGQHAAALKFGDPRAMALFQALCLFCLLPGGFRNAMLREVIAPLMGESPEDYKPGKMTYDLRRLKLHGIIEKISHTHRYQITQQGMRICLFFTKVYARVLRPGLSQIGERLSAATGPPIAAALHRLEEAIKQHIQGAKLTAAEI